MKNTVQKTLTKTSSKILNRLSRAPSPNNCVEFINEDGKRFAWSESNVRYEEVAKDGDAFTTLRSRLDNANKTLEAFKYRNAFTDFPPDDTPVLMRAPFDSMMPYTHRLAMYWRPSQGGLGDPHWRWYEADERINSVLQHAWCTLP